MWSHIGIFVTLSVESVHFRTMVSSCRYVLRIISYDQSGSLLEQVLGSSPHPHLFDDLLVQAGSLILQFAPASLGERVATLRQEDARTACQRTRSFYLTVGKPKFKLKDGDNGCAVHCSFFCLVTILKYVSNYFQSFNRAFLFTLI